MSKISELEMVITDLRNVAVTINDIANSLSELFGGTKTVETATEEATLTLEAVRAVLADKSRNGHTAKIRLLLQKYGATKLSEIDPSNYEALLKDAEGFSDVS